ncbi:hypothetical protein HOI83_02245 [Candidatus Uhrbacteria bacterium]|jgi:hypothetical protein|nr:hypothetical protein [Candidatus Uhrbacteria bacterium]
MTEPTQRDGDFFSDLYKTRDGEEVLLRTMQRGPLSEVVASMVGGRNEYAKLGWKGTDVLVDVRNVASSRGGLVISGMVQHGERLRFMSGAFDFEGEDKSGLLGAVMVGPGIGHKIAVLQLSVCVGIVAARPVLEFVRQGTGDFEPAGLYLYTLSQEFVSVKDLREGAWEAGESVLRRPMGEVMVRIVDWAWTNDVVLPGSIASI